MEELILDIIPEFYEWIGSYLQAIVGFFGAGILIAFIIWTIGFTIDWAYGTLNSFGR